MSVVFCGFRGVAFALTVLASIMGANAANAASFNNAQKDEIGKIVREYLLKNPDLLVEVMAELEAKQASAEQQRQDAAVAANEKAIYNDPTSFVAGNPNGDVTIVEFFDYHCGYCKRAFGPLMNAVHDDGKIKLILKEFPILGPDSVIASHAALAAEKQGKYFEMHQALYRNKGDLDEQRIMEIAKEVGLDIAKLRRDMADPEISKTIARNEKLADALGVKGTPGFIIGGKSHPGALDAEELAAAVKEARAN
ncbi:MAG: DsbA family protein [Parvibaculum sp.]|uniref:DsbA family protein n=1 Tax=Parvibaculum sp. TaxID=2024848 RepID=UPI0025FD4AA3|nr:DsbA family protein [Parvibaculum sp.]MCE9648827.1 DsbA family protein [Parvibaculum sp.]